MSAEVPAWLSGALVKPHAGHARLTVARIADEKTLGRGGFRLSSAAFANGDPLDPCFTADEEDAVAPPLEWTAPPPARRNWSFWWKMPMPDQMRQPVIGPSGACQGKRVCC